MLKQAIKRRKPGFNESYYGFRTFGNLLEEAQARGLLEFGRDEKSGAYVYRSAKTGGETVAEQPALAPARKETMEASAVAAPVIEVPTGKQTRQRRRGSRKPAEKKPEVLIAGGTPPLTEATALENKEPEIKTSEFKRPNPLSLHQQS